MQSGALLILRNMDKTTTSNKLVWPSAAAGLSANVRQFSSQWWPSEAVRCVCVCVWCSADSKQVEKRLVTPERERERWTISTLWQEMEKIVLNCCFWIFKHSEKKTTRHAENILTFLDPVVIQEGLLLEFFFMDMCTYWSKRGGFLCWQLHQWVIYEIFCGTNENEIGLMFHHTWTRPHSLISLCTRRHTSFQTGDRETRHDCNTCCRKTVKPTPAVRVSVDKKKKRFNNGAESQWRAVTLTDVRHCNEVKADVWPGRPAASAHPLYYCELF